MRAQESDPELLKQPVARKRRRFSIVSWFCGFVVLVFWLLVAGPGQLCGTGGRPGYRITHRFHGWPANHCLTFNAIIDPYIVGTPEEESILDDIEWSKESFYADYFQNRFTFEWTHDAYLYPEDTFFWSDPEKWKYFGRNVQLQILWSGLAVNLLLLFGAIFILICLIEFRVRKGAGLFRVRLKELMVLFTLVAVVVGLVVTTLKESANNHRHAQVIKELLENPSSVGFRSNRSMFKWKNRLPSVLKRLLDNRDSFALPWSNHRLTLDQIEAVKLVDVQVLPEDRQRVVECLKQFTAVASLEYYSESTDPWLLDIDVFQTVQHLNVDDAHNSDFRWLRNFQNLRAFEYRGPNTVPLEFVLEEIPKPEKLLSFSMDSISPVDSTTDFRRFKNLKKLMLPDLQPEIKRALIEKDHRLKQLLILGPFR